MTAKSGAEASSSIWQETGASSTESLFEIVTDVLGSARFESSETGGANANTSSAEMRIQPSRQQDTLPSALQQVKILCPCLSLDREHKIEDEASSEHPHPRTKNQAEKLATSLLERPVTMCFQTAPRPACDPSLGVQQHKQKDAVLLMNDDNDPTPSPERLLESIYKSFAVLVESRIRAYAMLIQRHTKQLRVKQKQQQGDKGTSSVAVGDMNERLDRLFLVGAAVYAERMETRFELEPEGLDDDYSATTSSSRPLSVHVLFDLVMPRPTGEKQVVAISVEAPGEIRALSLSPSKQIETVEIKLDTLMLLTGLMEQAAKVVAAVAEIARSDVTVSPGSQSLARSASFLAMPPPSPRSFHNKKGRTGKRGLPRPSRMDMGLELLSQAAAALPIVSPDILSGRFPELETIPSLRLEVAALSLASKNSSSSTCPPPGTTNPQPPPPPSLEEDDLITFSADQCADIVDNIFDDVDDSVFCTSFEPPSKRARTGASFAGHD